MADISTITLANGKTYNIKDAVARQIVAGAIKIVGKTTTALTDNCETNPITVNGESYTAIPNDAAFFGHKEFVFDGTKWHEFGDMTGLGDLALKNSASGTYTPEGTINNLEFTGAQLNSTGNFTPTGDISVYENNDGNYQPAGSISTPVISLKTAGATTTVNSITDVGTLPVLNIEVDELAENLSISFDSGTLPTKGANVTVKTSDAAYMSSTPSFTGTNVQIDFSGNEGNINVTGTPSGTVTKPVFTGKEAVITVS